MHHDDGVVERRCVSMTIIMHALCIDSVPTGFGGFGGVLGGVRGVLGGLGLGRFDAGVVCSMTIF